MELAGKCKNALEAFNDLNKSKIDLMLLDINMPEISGMSFLKSLKNPPLVIFTTAYSEFAAESYDHNAIDYLLKPISFTRFELAIEKAIKAMQQNNLEKAEGIHVNSHNSSEIIFLKSEGRLVKIDLAKLWLVEGLKDYVVLRLDNAKIIVHSTMKNLQGLLAGHSQFVRVHKSYIINIRHISELDSNSVKIRDMIVPIGNTFKEDIEKILRGLRE